MTVAQVETDYTNRYPNFLVHLNTLGDCHAYWKVVVVFVVIHGIVSALNNIALGLPAPDPIITEVLCLETQAFIRSSF